MQAIEVRHIQLARERIRPYVNQTLLEQSTFDSRVWLKLENTNRTHSFKIRGAINAIFGLQKNQKSHGVVAASSGNHAQALSYAASLMNISAKIVMPRATPQRKINGVKRYGAEAIVVDGTYDDAEIEARRIEKDEGRIFISAYNDPLVIAGQGTIGLEILEQLPDVERVLICVSGGGLIAGIALALKTQKPDIEIIGVCASSSPAMYNRFHDTNLPPSHDTLAEALAGDIEDGCITVPITKQYVDNIVLVDEEAIAGAMRWAILEAGWVVEGGGAVCIAALRSSVVPSTSQKTVAIVSGGNVDPNTLQNIICR